VAYSIIETVSNLEAIKHPAVREAIRLYAPHLGLEIHHDGDLPSRSGVGSSSAFATGLIHSLLVLKGEKNVKKEQLARLAINLEHDILRENVGIQDQIACSYGGLNFITFGPSRDFWKVERINTDSLTRHLLENNLYLYFSGVSRYSSDISAGLTQNISTKKIFIERSVNMAMRCKEMILQNDDLSEIGELFQESWENKRSMNSLSITPELDAIYDKAKRCGATGGKVLGAGGGGFMLFWVPDENSERFLHSFDLGTRVPFSLEDHGSICLLN
jgi:D-glycero-alpha-D-manno-heptose-7-phosphate kinase